MVCGPNSILQLVLTDRPIRLHQGIYLNFVCIFTYTCNVGIFTEDGLWAQVSLVLLVPEIIVNPASGNCQALDSPYLELQ